MSLAEFSKHYLRPQKEAAATALENGPLVVHAPHQTRGGEAKSNKPSLAVRTSQSVFAPTSSCMKRESLGPS
jgi:hypothetical protein